MELLTLLFTLSAVALYVYFTSTRRRKSLISFLGPKGHFITGNTLHVDPLRPHMTFSKWANEYGDVYKIRLFGKDIVLVNSLQGITEILIEKSEDFAGRPRSWRTDFLLPDKNLAMYDLDCHWSLMKKLSIKGIKQVGSDAPCLEDLTNEMVDELVKRLLTYAGQLVDLKHDIYTAVTDITFCLVFGRKLAAEEQRELQTVISEFLNKVFGRKLAAEEQRELQTVISEFLNKVNPTADNRCLDSYSFLRYPFFSKYRELQAAKERADKFFKRHLSLTLASHNIDECSCALDGLITEMIKRKDDLEGGISINAINSVSRDLIVGGITTTSTALYEMIALLAMHERIQSEAYDEVTKIIGQRPPCLKDRSRVAYIESMIYELLRYMSHLPVSVPHKTLQATSVMGHNIPSQTEVWPNFWHINHDERLWEDPWTFQPRRFLDSEGKLLPPNHPLRKQLFIFGAGRRLCAGEVIAINRLFLIVVTLIQRFQFLPPDDSIILTDPRDFEHGFILTPKAYKVKLLARH